MHRRLLRIAISFLSGVLWTLFLLSAFFTFVTFLKQSLFEAFVYTFALSIFWLALIVLVELAYLQIEKMEELQKQTKLLEEIAKKL